MNMFLFSLCSCSQRNTDVLEMHYFGSVLAAMMKLPSRRNMIRSGRLIGCVCGSLRNVFVCFWNLSEPRPCEGHIYGCCVYFTHTKTLESMSESFMCLLKVQTLDKTAPETLTLGEVQINTSIRHWRDASHRISRVHSLTVLRICLNAGTETLVCRMTWFPFMERLTHKESERHHGFTWTDSDFIIVSDHVILPKQVFHQTNTLYHS